MSRNELNTKVITGKIRMCYVSIFNPRAMGERGELKYSICLMIPKKDSETIRNIMKAVDNAIKKGSKLWGDEAPEELRMPLRDGDEIADERPEFAGNYYLNATSRTKPGIVDNNLNIITDSSLVYSGCYGRASIRFYPYSISGILGIAVALNNVQKLSDGEYLGEHSSAEEDFRDNNNAGDDFILDNYEKYVF